MTAITQHQLFAILADELDAARAQVDRLGLALTGDSGMAARYTTELQALDHIGQRCASVALILRSGDLLAATRAATLESIAERLAG